MKPLSSLLIIAWLALFCVGSAGAADEVQRHLEVYDLPQHRLTGDPAERKDHPVAMNIFVPSQPSGPRPCIILVHGGGWGGGDIGDAEKIRGGRSYGHGHDLIAAGLARGFVMVNFNYHLSPKGIFPQVYDDFRDAVRFLRANAATYQIDPTRIGATGFSAGGWLLGTACWVNGEYAVTSATARNAMPLADLLADKVRKRDPGVYLPMGQERTEYPQQYALIQAVSYDFQHNFERLLELKEFPAINRWCGLDVKIDPAIAAAGMLFSHSELTDEKYRGQGVHVPGMEKPARSRTGDNTPLGGRVLEFFTECLIEKCRTPFPEVRPGVQVFAERCEVTFVTPDPSVNVHYTLDGSQPTSSSPKFRKPIPLTADTTVKTFVVMPGREPSLVTTSRFWKRPVVAAKLAPQIQQDGNRYLVVVPADQHAAARVAIVAAQKSNKLKPTEWSETP